MPNANALIKRAREILDGLDGDRYPETCQILFEAAGGALTPFEIASRLVEGDRPGRLPPRVTDYIRALYEAEIDAGNHHAMNNLGNCYYSGDRGFEQSFGKAVALYERAAQSGNRVAQENLGYCYYYGRDVEVDYEKAFHCFALGAFDGHLVSLYKIGDMYLNGYYVKKNEEEAFRIYCHCLAAMSGKETTAISGPVRLRLGDMYLNGVGTAPNPDEALLNYSIAEIAFIDMIKKGEYMYKKSLRRAIEGQEKARAALAETMPEEEWPFDD